MESLTTISLRISFLVSAVASLLFFTPIAHAQKTHWGIEEHTPIILVEAQPFTCISGTDGAMNPPPPPRKLELKKEADGTFSFTYFAAGWNGIDELKIAEKLACKADPKNFFLITCQSSQTNSMASTEIMQTSRVQNFRGDVRVATRGLGWSGTSSAIRALPDDLQRAIYTDQIPKFDLQRTECKLSSN